ncbi:unnamed protein product [Spirodela intermedia]|uniref:Uncharacterized protein n=1 Tax=Spirodela intermedia TaxID=51605 RepID=A0ABN7E7Y1_SPIIN|nr:unnamed protein product [Spirodela intermedia]
MRLRGGLECHPSEGKKREIKAQSIVFSCSRLLWRRDYLEHIKIIIDQASLGLRLTHNEVCARSRSRRPLTRGQ